MGRVSPQNFGACQKNGRDQNFGAGGTDDMNFYYNSMKFYL